MAKLTAKQRRELPDSSFALPKQRKYPIKTKSGAPDPSHAANAKARATQMQEKGKLSKSKERMIDKKADKVLARKR